MTCGDVSDFRPLEPLRRTQFTSADLPLFSTVAMAHDGCGRNVRGDALNLTQQQFSTLVEAAATAGGRARSDFLADGMRTSPCVAIEGLDVKTVWNLSSVLAERDPGLSRSLRGPAVEALGRRATIYWPGVTCE